MLLCLGENCQSQSRRKEGRVGGPWLGTACEGMAGLLHPGAED